MKAKKYIALLLTAVSLVWVFPGCSKDDSEAPVNIKGTTYTDPKVLEALKILQNPSNGWVMRVFPSREMTYGGFTSLVRFNDKGEVMASSELREANTVYTSLYGIDQSNGMTLNFTTYNRALAVYSEPQVSGLDVSPTPQPHKGLDGDNAFQFVSVSADKVVLRGVHSRRLVTLTPLEAGADWQTTLEDYQSAPEEFAYAKMQGRFGSKLFPTAVVRDRHLVLIDDQGGEQAYPMAYTPKGFELYEPITLSGVTVQTFEFNHDAAAPAFVGAGGQARIEALEVELSGLFESALSFTLDLDQGLLGGRAKDIGDHLVAYYEDAAFWNTYYSSRRPVLRSVSLGTVAGMFGVQVRQSWFGDLYAVTLPMDVTFTAPNEFTFKYRPDKIPTGTDAWYLTHTNREYKMHLWAGIFSNFVFETLDSRSSVSLVIADGNTDGRTFKVSINNKFRPTEVTLEDTQDPASIIKF